MGWPMQTWLRVLHDQLLHLDNLLVVRTKELHSDVGRAFTPAPSVNQRKDKSEGTLTADCTESAPVDTAGGALRCINDRSAARTLQ